MSKITENLENELWDKGLRVPTYTPEEKAEMDRIWNEENGIEETLSHPDARMHQIVSFIKSGIRTLGYLLIPFSLPWAAGILVASEVVGIIEELV